MDVLKQPPAVLLSEIAVFKLERLSRLPRVSLLCLFLQSMNHNPDMKGAPLINA